MLELTYTGTSLLLIQEKQPLHASLLILKPQLSISIFRNVGNNYHG